MISWKKFISLEGEIIINNIKNLLSEKPFLVACFIFKIYFNFVLGKVCVSVCVRDNESERLRQENFSSYWEAHNQ